MSIPTYKLTKEQQEKTKKIFTAMDSDKSGYIEVKELGQVCTMLEKLGIVIDKKNLEVVVTKFDKGSKKLNLDQFSQMLVYLLDLKTKAESQVGGSAHSGQKISVTAGGSKPTTATTSKSTTTVTTTSGGSKPATTTTVTTTHKTTAPAPTTSSTKTLQSHSAPAKSSASTPTVTITTSTSKSKTRKPPLRRLKDAFLSYHKQLNSSLSKDKEKEHATIIVSSEKSTPSHPPSKSPSTPSKAPAHAPSLSPASTSSSSSSKVDPSSLFVDNSFPANNSVLPRHATSGVVSWKRPYEMCDSPRLFVDGTEEGDVVQGALGNCWFVGALAVLASSGNDFIEQTFVKADTKRGEYKCKFYKDGGWVMVTVDDRLPCGKSGKPYFASCPDPNEWWVPIIEKAYAKLHGSYEAIESGSISDALKDMTGEAVDMIDVDAPQFKDKSQLWKLLLHNTKESFLMGCAIENPGAAAEQDNGYGLLSNHAYSIIDCQEVQGHKLLRIRNPWGKGEWKGAWSDGSKEWTPALKKHFDFEFGNDGTFFMKFDDFVKFYNRIHVLCLLTDDQGEVWKKYVIKGSWKGETAGGCSNHATWPNNPQYMLVSSSPNNKVLIGMSQSDLRYKHKKSPAKGGLRYEGIGVIVLKTSEPVQGKLGPHNAIEREGAPTFMMQRDISFDFVAQKDKTFVLVPCTFNNRVEGGFELIIYSQRGVKIQELHGSAMKK